MENQQFHRARPKRLPPSEGRCVTFANIVPAPPPPEPPQKSSSFFLPDAFTNPEHIHYALKTTAAAMFCYVLYSLLDWPGIHTCLITCYIVSLGTAAETIEKLTLRILGCLVGAASGIAAIVYLIPYTTSIGDLMALVFVGAFASAWFAVGSPRIAYAGFQIAFALFLCVIQGSGPSFDMENGQGSSYRHFARQYRCLSSVHQHLASEHRPTCRSDLRGSVAEPAGPVDRERPA